MNVVLFGPPLAGKFSILQTVAEARSWRQEIFEIHPEGQAFPERGFRVAAEDRSSTAVTISGCAWSMATWDVLLQPDHAIIAVLDPQESRMETNREYLAHLGDRRNRVVGMQMTKADLVGRARAELAAQTLATEFALVVPIAISTHRDRASMGAFL